MAPPPLPARTGVALQVESMLRDYRFQPNAPKRRALLRSMFEAMQAAGFRYDEALEQLGPLKTEQVVDPAALLFFQAVIHHHTLNRDAGFIRMAAH